MLFRSEIVRPPIYATDIGNLHAMLAILSLRNARGPVEIRIGVVDVPGAFNRRKAGHELLERKQRDASFTINPHTTSYVA